MQDPLPLENREPAAPNAKKALRAVTSGIPRPVGNSRAAVNKYDTKTRLVSKPKENSTLSCDRGTHGKRINERSTIGNNLSQLPETELQKKSLPLAWSSSKPASHSTQGDSNTCALPTARRIPRFAQPTQASLRAARAVVNQRSKALAPATALAKRGATSGKIQQKCPPDRLRTTTTTSSSRQLSRLAPKPRNNATTVSSSMHRPAPSPPPRVQKLISTASAHTVTARKVFPCLASHRIRSAPSSKAETKVTTQLPKPCPVSQHTRVGSVCSAMKQKPLRTCVSLPLDDSICVAPCDTKLLDRSETIMPTISDKGSRTMPMNAACTDRGAVATGCVAEVNSSLDKIDVAYSDNSVLEFQNVTKEPCFLEAVPCSRTSNVDCAQTASSLTVSPQRVLPCTVSPQTASPRLASPQTASPRLASPQAVSLYTDSHRSTVSAGITLPHSCSLSDEKFSTFYGKQIENSFLEVGDALPSVESCSIDTATELGKNNFTTPVVMATGCNSASRGSHRLPRRVSGKRVSVRTVTKRDAHRYLGDWMTLVDLAVAEKASAMEEDGKASASDVLASAARSLGALGLLAAGAADCASFQEKHRCNSGTSLSNDAAPNFQNACAASFPLYPDERCNRAARRISRSVSPPRRFNFTPPLNPSQKDNVQQSSYPTSNYSSSRRLSSNVMTPSCTPIPLLRQARPNEKTTVRRTPHTPSAGTRGSIVFTRSKCSVGSSSALLRAPTRQLIQGRSRLLRGIRFRNVEDVVHAVTTCGADPNGYFVMSTSHVPWTIAAPLLWSNENVGSQSALAMRNIRLHPLHLAVATSSPAVVRTLLRLGACVNALDEWHRHPLHVLLQPPPASLYTYDAALSSSSNCAHDHAEDEGCAVCLKKLRFYRHLSQFLLKQTVPRTSVEGQIANVLYQAGINLTSKDYLGNSCVDYAAAWVQIHRLVQRGTLRDALRIKIGTQEVVPFDTMSASPGSYCIPTPCPPKTHDTMLSPGTLQTLLLSRVPQALIDTVALYEDRLRLEALRSIVGLRAGGIQSPTRFVSIHPHEANYDGVQPSKAFSTPRPNNISPPRSSDWENTRVAEATSRKDVRQPFSSSRLHLSASSGGIKSLERCITHHVTLYPPSKRSTELTAGSCRVRLRVSILPQPTCITPPLQEALKTDELNNRQEGLALSCLHALRAQTHISGRQSVSCAAQTEYSYEEKIVPECDMGAGATVLISSSAKTRRNVSAKEKQNGDEDDLTQFLRLATASPYRFHPAFSGVWEFLGATIFPKLETERAPTDQSNDNKENIHAIPLAENPSPVFHPVGETSPKPCQVPAYLTTSLSPLPILCYPDSSC